MVRKSLQVLVVSGAFTCLALISQLASAEDTVSVCATPKTMGLVRLTTQGYELVITVDNPTRFPLEFHDFTFFENVLQFRAVPAGESQALKHVVPLLSPGAAPVVVAPFQKIEMSYNLLSAFPELDEALKTKDVLFSWRLSLKGENFCFSQDITSSVWLRSKITVQ